MSLQFAMSLGLGRIASLSAPRQALGNSAGVSHKSVAPVDVYTHVPVHPRLCTYVHASMNMRIPTWRQALTRVNTRGPTCERATPDAVWSVQWCVCVSVIEYPEGSCLTTPPCRSLCSHKLREPEEKGFASSPLAAEITATLWQVLLMWDLSGWEIRGQFLLLWFNPLTDWQI